DRIAREGRLDIGGKFAPVGEDPARVMDVLDQDVGGLGRDDDFHRVVDVHYPRHAGREAGIGRVVALPAARLVRPAGGVNGLVLLGQRRLLIVAWATGVVTRRAGVGTPPLAFPVGIFRFIEGPHAAAHGNERERDPDQGPHVVLPWRRPSTAGHAA